MLNEIILASGNSGKALEIEQMLEGSGIHITLQTEYNVSSVEETGLSFVENALIKARHATKVTGLPSLGDDSGLVVDYLSGAPGIYSSRYAGDQKDDQANNDKLLLKMKNVENRKAHFFCALVLVRHYHDPEPLICQGRWHGEILTEPRGDQGFGYDPIFYVPTHNCSAGEMAFEEKNKISHRGQALDQLQKLLQRTN